MISFSRLIFIGIFIVWNLASIIYIDSLGSLRQSLPQNIISWLAITLIISIISFIVFYEKNKITLTLPAICFCFALFILMFEMIFKKNNDSDIAFWYWSGITVGVLLYIIGLQIRKKWIIQSFCIYCFIAISGIQALLTTYQYLYDTNIFYLAAGMRSNGLSQQINVLSVNMATACILSLTTLALSQFTLTSKHQEKIRTLLLGALIFLFTLTIVVLQSVTTLLSFGVSIFIFICLFYKKNQARISASYFTILIAFFTGIYLMKLCPLYIEVDTMNQFHLKQMLRFSITLFLEQPYDAWEQTTLLQDNYERTAIPLLSSKSYIVPHSHNEILLWLMSGSYISIIFISLLLTGVIYIIFQSFIKYKQNGNGYSLALILAITPIFIHNNVEYPFLLSVLHWGVIILFSSFSDAAFPLEKQLIYYINNQLSMLFSFITFILGASIFIIGLFLFAEANTFSQSCELLVRILFSFSMSLL